MLRYIFPLIVLVFTSCKKENESINSNSPLEYVKTEHLSVARSIDKIMVFDNKVFFISGLAEREYGNAIHEDIDIYDLTSKTWSSHKLSQRKNNVICFITSNKLIIMGGYTKADMSHTIDIYSSTTKTWTSKNTDFALAGFRGALVGNNLYLVNIDSYDLDGVLFMIYDIENDVWTKGGMPTPASNRSIIASDNKLYIGGGEYYDAAKNTSYYYKTVDIYDIETKTWQTDSLSVARKYITTTKVDNKLFFIGGKNASGNIKTIDIYDTQTNTWETSELPQTFEIFSLINTRNYLFLMNYTLFQEETDAMAVFDKHTNSWSSGHWGTPRSNRQLAVSDKYLIIGGGNFQKEQLLDIYNQETNSWSMFKLNENNDLTEKSYKIVGDSLLFVAGGCILDMVHYTNTTYSSKVDIYRFK